MQHERALMSRFGYERNVEAILKRNSGENTETVSWIMKKWKNKDIWTLRKLWSTTQHLPKRMWIFRFWTVVCASFQPFFSKKAKRPQFWKLIKIGTLLRFLKDNKAWLLSKNPSVRWQKQIIWRDWPSWGRVKGSRKTLLIYLWNALKLKILSMKTTELKMSTFCSLRLPDEEV